MTIVKIAVSSRYFSFFPNWYDLDKYRDITELVDDIKHSLVSFFMEHNLEALLDLAIKNCAEIHFHGIKSIDKLKVMAAENPEDTMYICDHHGLDDDIKLEQLIPLERKDELLKLFKEHGLVVLEEVLEKM